MVPGAHAHVHCHFYVISNYSWHIGLGPTLGTVLFSERHWYDTGIVAQIPKVVCNAGPEIA